jgi:glycosyltransferase involved in cell wall biosynthesis
MKVLMTTATTGGLFTYTSELAAALEGIGVEVVVATMGPRLRREQRERLPEQVHESGFRLEWMEEPWDDVDAAADWLLGLEEETRPDVVHLCSYSHGAAPFQAPKLVVAHSSVLSWWRAVRGVEAPGGWNRYRAQVGEGLREADLVVAPTRAMLAELERDHDLGATSATVLHHGTATPPRPGLPAKDELVLGCGRFRDPAKNLPALDAAAERLPWPVAIVGEPGAGVAPKHAEATGVLGQAQLAAVRRSTSIYAAPALHEPFGLGVLEAAQDGCALVLGDIPSLRELWDGAAVFVDPRDEQALRWALEGLIEDGARLEELSIRAHRRAATYSIGRAARRYLGLYERLRTAGRTGVAA